ncbi:11876_t:CDS:2 [Diversispora eburnea]|uniref:11876_t:CDS:1 n=1 Tax=Diversispora eburnea TaxID=1213867 RepID=A0A9N8YY33_9GLOM|nr:11876_t:CDS:2 [Diversispora eburnea]
MNRKSRSNLLFVIFIITLTLQCLMQIVIADEWDDDDDKFDSSESVSSSAQPAFTPKSEPLPPPPQPIPMLVKPTLKLEDFYRESLIIALIVIYLINYIIGKRTNEGIAKRWMEVQYRLFKDNFAQVGTDTGSALIKDGPADFLFYLTGRRNCQYVHGRITLKPRHDIIQLVSNFITSQFSSNNITDTVI